MQHITFVMSVHWTFDEDTWIPRLEKLGLTKEARLVVLQETVLAAVQAVHDMANVRRAALRGPSEEAGGATG